MVFITYQLEFYMKFLHSMIRVYDLKATLDFFAVLGLKEVRRRDSERGRFTLVFLETDDKEDRAQIELTHNWISLNHMMVEEILDIWPLQ